MVDPHGWRGPSTGCRRCLWPGAGLPVTLVWRQPARVHVPVTHTHTVTYRWWSSFGSAKIEMWNVSRKGEKVFELLSHEYWKFLFKRRHYAVVLRRFLNIDAIFL